MIDGLDSVISEALTIAENDTIDAQLSENLEGIQKLQLFAKNYLEKNKILLQKMEEYAKAYTVYEREKKKLENAGKEQKNISKKVNDLKNKRSTVYRTINSIDFKNFMRETFKFQILLNEAIGQITKTIYVYRSKKGEVKIFELDEKFIADTISKSSTRSNIIGKYSNSLAKMEKATSKYKNIELKKENSSNLTATYNNVYKRGEIYRQKIKNSGALLILWHLNEWKHLWVSNFGDINEAYASFFLAEQFDKFNNSLEHNVDTFMTDEKYGVVTVSNISGLLEGDLELEKDGILTEYAIKSRNAGTLQIGQVIKFAEEIAFINPQNVLEKIKAKKQELHDKEHRRNFEKSLEDDLREATIKALTEGGVFSVDW